MSKSTHSTSTSKHQILSPSLETQSNEEIELFKAIKASEDQFKLENQLNIQESNQIEKAIKISKNKDLGQGMDRVNQPSRRLPPGAAYPTEKDYLVEDELLAIAIQLSIEENDHQNRIQTLEHQIPPPLPNRRERRQVPDIPLIPPPLPPRKKSIHHFNENRFHDLNHHHFSDEFSDDTSLDSDDELNSFDDLSIHSSHYNPLDSTTNLINQRSFMNEENDDNRTNHHHSDSELHLSELHNLDQELRSFGERDESWIPTRKTSIQDSFVTAIDELDRNSRLESDSIHQARSSLLSERDVENQSVYEDASIPNDLSGSTDTLHHLKVDEKEFQTPNLSLGSSDTIRQVEVDDQPSAIPCGISDQSHSIQELGMNDQRSRSRNSLLDPSDIQQVEENDEECRTPKVDLSNPMNEIQEVEDELNENSDNRNIEPLEDLMKSIQSIAKINYVKSQPEERNELEIGDELEEIDVEKCDEVLNVSDKQSVWIETKTCSDLLKWLMWWGEVKIENEEIGNGKGIRGMIKIKLNFKIQGIQSLNGRTRRDEEEKEESKLICKIEILKDLKMNQVGLKSVKPMRSNEKGKKRFRKEVERREELKDYEYLIEDPFMLPCRFSNIVIRLFTLIQLSNLASLTQPTNSKKQSINQNFFELKKLGECIESLEENQKVLKTSNQCRHENENGNGLIERLRDRLKRLKKVDQVDQRNPNPNFGNSSSRIPHNPLEVVNRSRLNGMDDQDRMRWLPIL